MQSQSHSRMPVGELICAGSLLAAGAFIVVYGLRYPLFSDGGVVGPGLMPIMAGTVLTVVSAVLVVRTARAIRTVNSSTPDERPAKVGADQEFSTGDLSADWAEVAGKPLTVAGILIMLVLTVLLAPVIGLIPMLGLLVFVSMLGFERQGLLIATLMAIGITALNWLLFVGLFEVPVPTGSLWLRMGW